MHASEFGETLQQLSNTKKSIGVQMSQTLPEHADVLEFAVSIRGVYLCYIRRYEELN